MPLPLIIGIGAGIAALGGTLFGAAGVSLTKEANDTMNSAKEKYNSAQKEVDDSNKKTIKKMDELGKLEANALASFQRFADAFEKVKNKPSHFNDLSKNDVKIPPFNLEELKDIALGANAFVGGLASAAVGTAAGLAASGGIMAAVTAFGTATTGTAIASLSGAAASNAAFAAIGGGALTAGGLGVAGGTALLAGATAGIGLLVGGIAFGFTGAALSCKADEAYSQACEAEKKSAEICGYLNELYRYSEKYMNSLKVVYGIYIAKLERFEALVNIKCDWQEFSKIEQVLTKNLVLLVGLLLKMCQIKLVLEGSNKNEMNTVNKHDIDATINDADMVIHDIA